jgi:small subunit ribosomal protein S17
MRAEDIMSEETTTAKERASRKVRQGVVVSDKMDKTVTVMLSRRFAHAKYGKQVTRTTKVKARNLHDAKTGDTVRIMETRPIAKTVCWRTVEVIERAR